MGLAEQLRAGAQLERTSTTFTTDVSGVGTVQLSSVYTILSIQSDVPCRLRLYENAASRDNAGEVSRAFNNVFVSSSVALIADFSMSQAGIYSTDPSIFAVTQNLASPDTFYRIEPSSPSAKITLRTFPLEDNTITAAIATPYSVANRRSFTITTNLAAAELVSGTLADATFPTSYLLVSSSLADNSQRVRLRLYSTTASFGDATERNRPFTTEPSASMDLIVDYILSGSNLIYFSPKIIGANLANRGNNLLGIQSSQTLLDGKNELYYIMSNEGTGGTVTMNANLHVYSLED